MSQSGAGNTLTASSIISKGHAPALKRTFRKLRIYAADDMIYIECLYYMRIFLSLALEANSVKLIYLHTVWERLRNYKKRLLAIFNLCHIGGPKFSSISVALSFNLIVKM